jgi:hypothetical protein
MESWIYQEGLRQGQVISQREVCLDRLRKYHPAVVEDVLPAIEQCTDITLLKELILKADEWSDDEIKRRLS